MAEDNKASGTLVRAEENLDIVPVSISRGTAIQARHTQKYLLRKCQEHGITLDQLNKFIELKNDYSTNFSTMLEFYDNGFSLEEIGCFLEVRGELKKREIKSAPSLRQMSRFFGRFDGFPVNSEYLIGKIDETVKELGGKYTGTTLKEVIDVADELGISCLETVVDFLKGRRFGSQLGDDYSEESFP